MEIISPQIACLVITNTWFRSIYGDQYILQNDFIFNINRFFSIDTLGILNALDDEFWGEDKQTDQVLHKVQDYMEDPWNL